MTWKCCVLVLLVAAGAWADRAADEATFEQMRVKTLRPLHPDTVLVADGAASAAIVAPAEEPWATAATLVGDAVRRATGVDLPRLLPEAVTAADWAGRHLIVLGNLASNAVYARLYSNLFVCADAAYTGTAGYELRSVHDPWGQGHNVIALGGQAADGVQAGARRLGQLVAEQGRPGALRLGRLLELRFDRAGRRQTVPEPLTAEQIAANRRSLDAIYDQPGTEREAAQRTGTWAFNYHRTGDEGWFELYRYALARHQQYYAENEYIQENGPRRYDRDFRDAWSDRLVVAWDLLEEHPAWRDAERLAATNHVLRLVWECMLYQGWDTPERVAAWQQFASVTHNHHTFPGLACLFGGWYFDRHYQLPVAKDWLTVATAMFASCSRSWKPWEDSAGYVWLPIRHILTYALASGDRTFVESGQAAQAGEAVLQAIDSLNDQPAWGDHSGLSGVSGIPPVLAILGYVTGDGRYRWALDRLGGEGAGAFGEPYWTATPARPATEQVGLRASWYTRQHYDLLGTQADFFQKPNLPYEETFDKLVLRAGWEPDDDYLMLDGHAAGSHGHLDANAIISYTSQGAHWLVDGEYIRRIPKYHNAVTVLRNGVGATQPPSARVEQAAWFGDGALTQTTLPHDNGLAWTRTMAFVPDGYLAVIDELTAEAAGEYTVTCVWRLLGEAKLDGHRLTVRQLDRGFTLVNASQDDLELAYQRDADGIALPIHQLTQRRSARLEPGQQVRFVNVCAAAATGVPALDAALVGDGRVAVTRDGRTEVVGVGPLASAGLRGEALAWRVTDTAAWLLGARQVTLGGRPVGSTPEPQPLRLDAQGAATGVAQPVPVAGLRPVHLVGAGQPLAEPPALASVVAELRRGPAPPAVAVSTPAGVASLPVAWRYDRFSAAARPLTCAGVTANVEPLESMRPLTRLIDGRYTNSLGSCRFEAGQTVTLTLDLGGERRLSELRVRAWEMNAGWRTRSLTAELSRDGFQADIRPVPAALTKVGTQEWGSNVNTIYVAPLNDAPATQVRLTVVPENPEAAVYLAEIEVLGAQAAGRADLTALAAADLTGDGQPEALVGTAGGEVVALGSTGQPLWRAAVGGPVTALTAGPLGGQPRVVVGTSLAALVVLDAAGQEVGRVTPPRYRGIPSCARNIHLADLAGDGSQAIVIGCDSWQYLAYSADLKLLWKTVIYAHGATVAAVEDLDGDRRAETVAGNAYYRLNVIGPDGKMRFQAGRFGPEQTAVATGDLVGDGRREIVVGTDDGLLLAFDLDRQELWSRPCGDRLTALYVVDRQVVAASESGWLWRLDATGKPVWKRSFEGPLKRLRPTAGGWVAAAGRAGLLCLGQDGRVVATAATPGAARDVVVAGGQAVVTTLDGTVVGVALP